MKTIITLETGYKVICDILTPPHRKERETQAEYERRFVSELNLSQPNAVNKVIKCHILRH